MLCNVEYPNITDVATMRFMRNIDLLWCPPLLSAVVSSLRIVQIPSETTILDNKESNLPSAHWRQHIALILTGKCGARATEQCNWRGSWSRSGSRLGAGRTLLTDKRHGTCDLGFFFVPFFLPLHKVHVVAFPSLSRCISLPSQNYLLTLVKPHGAFFSCREFIMSCLSILLIPLNTLQADGDLWQPTCHIFIQPLRRSIIHCCRG